MATKRGHGEGSVDKYLVKGVLKGWRSQIMVGYNDNGKPKFKSFYGKTRKEVQDKLNTFKTELASDTNLDNEKITLYNWCHTWLFEYRKKDLKPKSFERYESLYRNYVDNKDIGSIKLKNLRATHLQRYYNRLLDSNVPLATVRQINTKLKTALNEAFKQGYIPRNYCTMVTLPKEQKEEKLEILTLEHQQSFVEAIKSHPLELLYLVALGTGLRLGEILGLKWSDLDFNIGTLTVNRSLQRIALIDEKGNKSYSIVEQLPKTVSSRRTIPVPMNILNKLKLHKKYQNKLILKSGDIYHNHDYVFCNELGYPIDDKKPLRNLQSILKKLGIEPIKFHGLRKTYATRLFENDVPPKTVQVLMGHSDITVTMNIYTQVMDEKKFEAVERLNDIFDL